jgi:hypothetical protein
MDGQGVDMMAFEGNEVPDDMVARQSLHDEAVINS